MVDGGEKFLSDMNLRKWGQKILHFRIFCMRQCQIKYLFQIKTNTKPMQTKNRNVLGGLIAKSTSPSSFSSNHFVDALKSATNPQLAQIDRQLARSLAIFLGCGVEPQHCRRVVQCLKPITCGRTGLYCLKMTGKRIIQIQKNCGIDMDPSLSKPLEEDSLPINRSILSLMRGQNNSNIFCLNCLKEAKSMHAIKHFIQINHIRVVEVSVEEFRNEEIICRLICGLINEGGGTIIISHRTEVEWPAYVHLSQQDKAQIGERIQQLGGKIYPPLVLDKSILINYIMMNEKGPWVQEAFTKTGLYLICITLKPTLPNQLHFVRSQKQRNTEYFRAYTLKNEKLSIINNPYSSITQNYASRRRRNQSLSSQHICKSEPFSQPPISDQKRWKYVEQIQQQYSQQSLVILKQSSKHPKTMISIISELYRQGISFILAQIYENSYLHLWLLAHSGLFKQIYLLILKTSLQYEQVHNVTHFIEVRDNNYVHYRSKVKQQLQAFFQRQVMMKEKINSACTKCDEGKKAFTHIYFDDKVHALKFLCEIRSSQTRRVRFVSKQYCLAFCSNSKFYFS